MAAKPSTQLFHLTTLILFFCLVLCQSSSARTLAHYNFYPRSLATTVKIGPSPPAATGDLKGYANGPFQNGDKMGSYKNRKMMVTPATQAKLGGIFGALVMNVLPKRKTPPSGPSRRKHGVINT